MGHGADLDAADLGGGILADSVTRATLIDELLELPTDRHEPRGVERPLNFMVMNRPPQLFPGAVSAVALERLVHLFVAGPRSVHGSDSRSPPVVAYYPSPSMVTSAP